MSFNVAGVYERAKVEFTNTNTVSANTVNNRNNRGNDAAVVTNIGQITTNTYSTSSVLYVAVVFSPGRFMLLKEYGINKAQAAEIRARLHSFMEDWEDPQMEIYNDYDLVKARV